MSVILLFAAEMVINGVSVRDINLQKFEKSCGKLIQVHGNSIFDIDFLAPLIRERVLTNWRVHRHSAGIN